MTLPRSRCRSAARLIEAGLAQGSIGRVLASPRWKHPEARARVHRSADGLQDAALSAGRPTAGDRHQPGHPGRGRRRSRSMRWWCPRVMSGALHRHLSRPQHRRRRSRLARRGSPSSRASRCRWPRSTMRRSCPTSSARCEGIDDIGDGMFAVRIGLATATVGHDAGQLLNMVFGNTSLHEDVVLQDVAVAGRPCRGVRRAAAWHRGAAARG